MSKMASDLPERLGSAGSTGLEQRLLRGATNERPTRELSERMARGIGVALPAIGAASLAKDAAAASKATSSFSTLLPWISGGLAAALVAGGLVALGSGRMPAAAPSRTAPSPSQAASAGAARALPTADAPIVTVAPQKRLDQAAPKPTAAAASQRSRDSMTASELAKEVALVDAARAALASGGVEHALSIVRDYQATYPNGNFRPEVAAIKIEALLKAGRKTEARASAERFATTYGSGPLAERVARLAGITQP